MYEPGIHHISAAEVDPVSFVSLAAETGFKAVSLFARQPGAQSNFPLIDRRNSAAVSQVLRDTGLKISNIESFAITPATDVAAFSPALELGAELGARGAVALLFDDNETRVADHLNALCDLASGLGLKVAIEFMPFVPPWNTLAKVADLVNQIAHPNLAIGIDILHMVRSGAGPKDVAALRPGLIGYAQLCDGADLRVTTDYAEEAAGNRLLPGDGVFPVAAFLRALPAGTPLELEVPQPHQRPPRERLERAMAATLRVIEEMGMP